MALKEDTNYATHQEAINKRFFFGRLPAIPIIIDNKTQFEAYYQPKIKIALNLTKLTTPELILAALAHEMCHHNQWIYGRPTTNKHDYSWALTMKELGLEPIFLARNQAEHCVIPCGPFDEFLADYIS